MGGGGELWETAQEPDLAVSAVPIAVDAGEAPEAADDEADPAEEISEGSAELPVQPVPPQEGRQVETQEQKGGFLGYSFVTSDGYGGRALEYGFLRSSPSGGLFYRSLHKDSNFELEGHS